MSLKNYDTYKKEHPDTDRIIAVISENPQGLSPFELAEIVWKSKEGDKEKALAMDNLLSGLVSDGKIRVKVKKTYFNLENPDREIPPETPAPQSQPARDPLYRR